MKYTVVLIPQKDGSYTVAVPSLPECVSEGDSIPQALEMAREAITLCLEQRLADGETIPDEPSPVVASVEVEIPTPVSRT